ncbi:MAG: DUF5994 family protein [Nocardioides sp.]|uniref:DUF5994 family protein n=1 Tax=Nocardioides sp. TaxID=35761 RepID=UPI003EFE589C
MTEHGVTHLVDGGWWPQSRDLAVELADLVDHFPEASGRVARVWVSPPDWDAHPRIVPVEGRRVKVGAFPHDDTHLIHLKTSDRTELHVLVVPPGFSSDQGDEALRASADPGNAHTALEILHQAAALPDSASDGRWSDDGGSW